MYIWPRYRKDGEVVLAGSVPSYPQYIEAAAVARRACRRSPR
jgi:hypothetical protein